MSQTKNKKKKNSNNNRIDLQVNQALKPQKILKVVVFADIVKPLNGATTMSKVSHLLKLEPISYTYGKDKITESITYFIKGLKGAVRHAFMRMCKGSDLEVCHSSDKEFDKHGKSFLPQGFHLLGACLKDENPCILQQIFGQKGQQSLISVRAPAITSIKHKTAEFDRNIQKVHIATETRIMLSAKQKTMQDFGERYFSGQFYFEINVTRCQLAQLGSIIQAVSSQLHRLGRGYTAGYRHIEVQEMQLLTRKTSTALVPTGESFKVQKVFEDKPIPQLVNQAIKAWNSFLEQQLKLQLQLQLQTNASLKHTEQEVAEV